MRAQKTSIIVCFLALLALLGRGAQVVFDDVAAQSRAQMRLVSAQETLGEQQPVHPLITVRLDSYGLPTEVSTNTGAPPQDNEAITATQRGRNVVVSDPLAALIHEHTYVGDWSVPGAWHTWTSSG